MQLRRSMLVLLAATGVMAAADSPFIGKWKLNPAKSQFSGTTTTYEKLPSGEMMSTSGGQSYKFKLDGKEYPGPFGDMIAWKQSDPNSFEVSYKNPGMAVASTMKISADGKTMTETAKGKKPNGEAFESTAVSERVSGGPGLAGKWKTTNVKATTEMWDIKANGADGLAFVIVDYNATVTLKFDGKDYPATGPSVPKNFTLSAKKTGERTLDMTEKMDGKVLSMDAMSVSADGKTMTVENTSAGTSEKTKAVYDRQ